MDLPQQGQMEIMIPLALHTMMELIVVLDIDDIDDIDGTLGKCC